jgi:hypothetical protein
MRGNGLRVSLLVVGICAALLAQQPPAQNAKPGLLTPDELKAVMPESVFFHGQRATVQYRNAAGIRSSEGKLVLIGMIDTSGYGTAIAERYQAYFITEVKLRVGDATLAPGAYGCGFVGGKFVIMDVGGNDAASTPEQMDEKLRRPRPLMVTLQSDGVYRLYLGKRFVVLTLAR